jgi:hypothetical protein
MFLRPDVWFAVEKSNEYPFGNLSHRFLHGQHSFLLSFTAFNRIAFSVQQKASMQPASASFGVRRLDAALLFFSITKKRRQAGVLQIVAQSRPLALKHNAGGSCLYTESPNSLKVSPKPSTSKTENSRFYRLDTLRSLAYDPRLYNDSQAG